MANVIQSLHEDHANMALLLNAIERQLAIFDQGETPDYDIIQGVLDYCLNYPDLYHHPKEDLVYRHLARRNPDAVEILGDLRAAHRNLADLTRGFSAAVHNVLQDLQVPRGIFDQIAYRFLEEYRRHMIMEDEIFLPAAAGSLTAQDWDEIDAQMKDQDDPLFGAAPEKRFAALREEVLAWAQEAG